MQEMIALYRLDMVWQQKQREEQQNQVSIGRAVARCKIARFKASNRQESYRKGSQKKCFFL
jgi:hypothetical protein